MDVPDGNQDESRPAEEGGGGSSTPPTQGESRSSGSKVSFYLGEDQVINRSVSWEMTRVPRKRVPLENVESRVQNSPTRYPKNTSEKKKIMPILPLKPSNIWSIKMLISFPKLN